MREVMVLAWNPDSPPASLQSARAKMEMSGSSGVPWAQNRKSPQEAAAVGLPESAVVKTAWRCSSQTFSSPDWEAESKREEEAEG